jgi:GNAT superfamily N-acetyltransferase
MTEPDLEIRRALSGEANVLTQIAHAAKRHWQYPEEWIALWRESLTITDTYLEEHQVFVGEVRETIAGFYALVQAANQWELDHFWINPDFMGRGIGRALFNDAIKRLKAASPGSILEIESDPNAESFYLHMGAKRIGEISRDWQGLIRTLPHLQFAIDAS